MKACAPAEINMTYQPAKTALQSCSLLYGPAGLCNYCCSGSTMLGWSPPSAISCRCVEGRAPGQKPMLIKIELVLLMLKHPSPADLSVGNAANMSNALRLLAPTKDPQSCAILYLMRPANQALCRAAGADADADAAWFPDDRHLSR